MPGQQTQDLPARRSDSAKEFVGKARRPLLGSSGPGCNNSVGFLANFFSGTLSGQGFLHPAFRTRLQVEGVTLYFLNDVFCLNLSLEPTQGVLYRLALL